MDQVGRSQETIFLAGCASYTLILLHCRTTSLEEYQPYIRCYGLDSFPGISKKFLEM